MSHPHCTAILLFGLIVPVGVGAAAMSPDSTRRDSPSTGAIRIRANIGGRSRLHVRGHTLRWYHLSSTPPGRWGGNSSPTLVNDKPWYPKWPGGASDNPIRRFSSEFSGLARPLPATPIEVGLSPNRARGAAVIGQQPKKQNGFTLVIDFDDERWPGSDWYDVTIHWPAPKREWSTVTSATVALHLALIDVTLPEGSSASLDLSPEALGLVDGPATRPATTAPAVEIQAAIARVPSLDRVLKALDKQGVAKLRLEHRMFAVIGAMRQSTINSGLPGEIAALIRSDVVAVKEQPGLIRMRIYARFAWLPDLSESDDPRRRVSGNLMRELRINRVTEFDVPSGSTIFLRMYAPPSGSKRTTSVLLVTANIIGAR